MSPIAFFLLSTLLLAHAVGDRLSIAESNARRRASIPMLASHALQLGLLSGLALLFAYSRLVFAAQAMPPSPAELGVLLAAVGIGHFGLDLLHLRVDPVEPREARADLADQLLHLSLLVLAVAVLSRFHDEWKRLAAGDLIVLGQPVGVDRFGTVASAVALLLLAATQGLRSRTRPARVALGVASRSICALVAFAGPLWLAVLFCGGAAGWHFRAGKGGDGWLHLLGASLMGFALRILRPD